MEDPVETGAGQLARGDGSNAGGNAGGAEAGGDGGNGTGHAPGGAADALAAADRNGQGHELAGIGYAEPGVVVGRTAVVVPTPPAVRWHRARHQLLPVLTFVLCLLVAWQLWRAQGLSAATAIGVVDRAPKIDVFSPRAGELTYPDDAEPTVGGMVAARDIVAWVTPQPTSRPAGPATAPAAAGAALGATVVKKPPTLETAIPVSAPRDGQIAAVHRHNGQHVDEGQQILSIAPAQGKTVTTYVRSGQRVPLEKGARVDVRLRSDPSKVYQGFVEQVGAKFDPVPAQQLRDQKVKEWGLPVTIALPDAAIVHPGELVDLIWRPAARRAG